MDPKNCQCNGECEGYGRSGASDRWSLIAAFLAGALGGAVAATLLHRFVFHRESQPVEVEPRAPDVPLPRIAPKVLIVDDDSDFVDLTGAILSQAGYRVATASDSEGAFRVLEREKPDLVLLDVMMKAPLEGIAISRRMAAERHLKDIPVVMISGIAQTDYASEFPTDIDLPIEAWISKPVDPTQILDTVQRILAGRA